MSQSLDDQVAHLMWGTQFGDAATRRTMEHELRERLREGRPLRVYCGIDATAAELHLGHSVPLRKLAQFQDLGHECTFLLGDFTATIGDPTGRDRTRPLLSSEQVQSHARALAQQALLVLDPHRTQVRSNSEWLERLSFAAVMQLAGSFTLAQFLERDNFARRYAKGEPIHLHELFYALMQAQDAVELEADVQIGGSDQTFNLMAGRRLQEARGMRQQVVLTTPLLPGTDGRQKMSKSLGNAIPLQTAADEMFGRLMSLPDEPMQLYFELLTALRPAEIAALFAEMEAGARHPRDVKLLLAGEVTRMFHGAERAAQAEAGFRRIFQQRELPEQIPVHRLEQPLTIVELLVELGLASSRSEARRLVQQGGVRLSGERIADSALLIQPGGGRRVLQVGRRRFIELC